MPVIPVYLFIALSVLLTIVFSCQPRKAQVPHEHHAYSSIGDNSRVSLDWTGSYKGTLPCADCTGIEMLVSLYSDNTYRVLRRYAGRGDDLIEEKGTFEWDQQGRFITLSTDNSKYLVGENRLFYLDKDGHRITGALAENYILDKLDDDITEKYWKLIELAGQCLKKQKINRDSYIILKADKKVIGSGYCNAINGEYETGDPNRLRFTSLSRSFSACDAIQAEEAFIQVLQIADSYSLDNDTLQLLKGRMAPLARFEAVYLR